MRKKSHFLCSVKREHWIPPIFSAPTFSLCVVSGCRLSFPRHCHAILHTVKSKMDSEVGDTELVRAILVTVRCFTRFAVSQSCVQSFVHVSKLSAAAHFLNIFTSPGSVVFWWRDCPQICSTHNSLTDWPLSLSPVVVTDPTDPLISADTRPPRTNF